MEKKKNIYLFSVNVAIEAISKWASRKLNFNSNGYRNGKTNKEEEE